jgi:thymidylate kinase
MKLLIIEGGDQLGKSSLIKGLCEHFNYDNVTIRHFGKPPKDLTSQKALSFQIECFHEEIDLYKAFRRKSWSKHNYFPNKLIWNRSHLGEYVYGQMFRGVKKEILLHVLENFERHALHCLINNDIYLITLTADPEFFHSKEDGNSFSNNIEDKTKELELFKEIHNFSLIRNKCLIKVDDQFGEFRPKEAILNEVIYFINE